MRRVYQTDLEGVAHDIEHFQKPTKGRSNYINITEEVADKYKPEMEDLLRLRTYDEAVEKVCTDRADDIIKPWFTLEPHAGVELPDDLIAAFEEWSTRIFTDQRNPSRHYTIQQVLMQSLDSANWSGNGIIYKIYDDIEQDHLEGTKEPVEKGARLIGYQVLPRRRVGFDDSDPESLFYAYNNLSSASVSVAKKNNFAFLRIHPSRIIDSVLKADPSGSWSGQSIITSAIILAIAKMTTSNDMPHMLARILPKHMLKFMTDNKEDKAYAQANLSGLTNRKAITLPKGLEYSIEGFKGKLIGLKDMYDIFYQALAIAADMPLDFLKGVSAGAVTGSEVNVFQYYKSIHNDQRKIEPSLVTEFLDYAKRNVGLTLSENIRFTINWGSVAPPNKKDEALVRLRHSQADKILFDAGLSLDTVNKERIHYGLPELETSSEDNPSGDDTGGEEEGQTAGSQTTHGTTKLGGDVYLNTTPIENRHIPGFEKMFDDMAQDVDDLFKGVTAFIKRALHQAPSLNDIDAVVDSYSDELSELATPLHEESVVAGIIDAHKLVGAEQTRQTKEEDCGCGQEHQLPFIDPLELEWIDERGAELVVDVLDTVRLDIRNALDKGIREGQGVSEIRRSIQDAIGSKFRAERIVRTETLTASGFARNKNFKDLDVLFHEWLTAGDEEVRDSHVLAEGEGAIPIDQRFGNGLLYPGDLAGDVGEIVNCRCAELPVTRRSQTRPRKKPPIKKIKTKTIIEQIGPGKYAAHEEEA